MNERDAVSARERRWKLFREERREFGGVETDQREAVEYFNDDCSSSNRERRGCDGRVMLSSFFFSSLSIHF